MNINLVELLENLTDDSRNTKELLEYGDQIKVMYKGAEIICYYNDPSAGIHQPPEEEE
jgi:hypothetical protein|tara:strand:- start:851 stop:1024 length:174 start_codon:yes stop_codon:yes gene_type:complete